MAAVLVPRDPNGGRPNPSIKETFTHDQGDQGLEGEGKSRKEAQKHPGTKWNAPFEWELATTEQQKGSQGVKKRAAGRWLNLPRPPEWCVYSNRAQAVSWGELAVKLLWSGSGHPVPGTLRKPGDATFVCSEKESQENTLEGACPMLPESARPGNAV